MGIQAALSPRHKRPCWELLTSAACNDGGNRHAPIAASHHLKALTSDRMAWMGGNPKKHTQRSVFDEISEGKCCDEFLTFRRANVAMFLKVQNGASFGGQIQKKLHHFLEIPSRLMSSLDSQPFLAQKPMEILATTATMYSGTLGVAV